MESKIDKTRILPTIALLLFLAEVVLMLVSWLLSAAMPNSGVRSILSSEGLRWFFAHFSENLASPVMVWIVLLAMGYGCVVRCGVLQLLQSGHRTSYRERRALLMSSLLLLAFAAAIALLTLVPHALLLSATGHLFPSPFSASLPHVIAFVLVAVSILYGIIVGRFETLRSVYESLLYGISAAAPVLLFYILLIQFYESLLFVFG